ncbi:hypothetical protein MKD41_03935 [Lutibacter sp. A64]|uniref:hypothetical protein n=1 Tax=Lutibacter sp. A64 TaxID=2918526 RepID=UPI001F05EEFE|nr:hypothetical protein [Lutibacter sp. A64]UMB54624.1 hypothetical protein MKD41_03935 [Lutibacter sp. A64]
MKTQLSNNTLLKFFNKELSPKEMTRVGSIINNSEKYKSKINELKVTYSLTNEKEKLEDNPYLYMEIMNKITENKGPKSSYNTYFVKRLFQPIMAISLILLTLYTGYNIGNINNKTTNESSTFSNKSEIYFNELQLEKFETILLIKE